MSHGRNAAAVAATLAAKQDALVSGTNIKTINGASALGSGDLTVSAGPPEDGSITNAKLANMDAGTVKMRPVGGSAGVPVDRTMAQLKTDLSLAKADGPWQL